MELDSIDYLNQYLIDHFGIDSSTGQAIFRIVWADDQLEKRRVQVTDSGVELLYPEVMEVKKYAYLKEVYVLERLVLVPKENQYELLDVMQSYEPIWVFRDSEGNALPPIWEATKFIVDALYAALGRTSLRKYVEDEKYTTTEGIETRISELQSELFGNETDVGDALAYKEGIIVPSEYKKES